MKKRFLALFLALAMALTMLPTAALAADSDNNDWLKDWEWNLSSGLHGITVSKFLDNTNPETVVVPDTTSTVKSGAINNPNMTVISLPQSIVSVGSDNGIENCKEIIYRGSKDTWFDWQGIYRLGVGGGRPRIDDSSNFPHKIPVKTLDGEIIDYVGPNDGTDTPIPTHTHAWSTAWSNDASYHWHNCTAAFPACDVTANSEKQGYGAHVYDNNQDPTCNTCGYTRTVESEQANQPIYDLLPSKLDAVIPPQEVAQASLWTHVNTKEPWSLSESGEAIFQKIAAQVESLVKGKDSETEKARAIYEWAAKNISYDYTAAKYDKIWINGSSSDLTEEQRLRVRQSADACCVFHLRRGICSGYAKLSGLMMTIAGLPSAYISGISKNGVPHAWSAVYADGKWILFDATWSKWNISRNFHGRVEELWFTNGLFFGSEQIDGDGIPDYRLMLGYQPGINCPSDVVIPDGVAAIGDWAFAKCTGLTSAVMPKSVTSVGSRAFQGCTGLTSVTIPDSVTSIGEQAFQGCTGLTSITIPDSMTSIGKQAFQGCTGLTSITIPDSVTSIGGSAFHGCTGLTSVTIPDSVTSLAYAAFSGCTGLTSVTIPNSVTSLEKWAFSVCTGLTSVTIPDSVNAIGIDAFKECTGLTSVTIPDSVTSIEYGAFTDCTNLKNVYYTGTETQWKAISIGDSNASLKNAAIHYNSTAFADVPANSWYAGAVTWAVQNGITNGTSETTFSPLNTCTCAQIITFLYRANGSPSVSGVTLPFAIKNAWAGDALKWAYSRNVIDDGFSEETPCTRYTAVDYIWKAFGCPAAQGGTNFGDIQGLDARAISWAVRKGIVNGTSATAFSPDLTCDRGTIVTLLFRAYN